MSDTLNENVPTLISEESWLHHFKSLHSIDPTNSTHEPEIHRELNYLEHGKEQFTYLDYEITEKEIRQAAKKLKIRNHHLLTKYERK